MEGFTKIVSENVSLKSFLFLQLLMVLSEGKRCELSKMLMNHNLLKTLFLCGDFVLEVI